MRSTNARRDLGAASGEATATQSLPGAHRGPAPGEGIGTGSRAPEPLIAYAPHAIAVTDGASHVLRQVNSAFCRLMGVEAANVLDRSYSSAFHGSAAADLLGLLQRVLATGEAEPNREVVQPGDPEEPVVWSYTIWPVRDRSGAVAGLVIEVQDRTEEVRSTRMLRTMADEIRQINERLLSSAIREQESAEKAEAAARAKSEFLSMMSHELRTPLNAIVSYTEILLGGYLSSPDEPQRECLQRISTASDHLLAIIDDVLCFSKVEAQGLKARCERVDLRRLSRETAAIVEPLAEKKGVSFRVDVEDDLVPVETDANILRQILVNLLGNAVKFTEKGEVRLEVCEDPQEGNTVLLRVHDTGIGILAQDLERIFEPFVQGEPVLTRRFGGTGLGLPISRALAELLGGALMVESHIGRGATFTLRLPHTSTLELANQ